MSESMSGLEQRQKPMSPAEMAVARLMSKSEFTRLDKENPNTTLERDGMKFTVEKVLDGNSELIPEVQKLLVDTFGPKEVDPEDILRAGIDGMTPWELPDITKYNIHVVKDEAGEIISLCAGGRLPLKGADGERLGKQQFMVGYAVTKKDVRMKGLAREAYVSAIMQASKEAEAEGEPLSLGAGEGKWTSENFWNSVGWKRAYVKIPGKEVYEELRYIQPALDFNEKTGEIAEDAGAAAEHFMADSFGDKSPTKEEILAIVRGWYEWCNIWPIEAFADAEDPEAARAKHLEHIAEVWNEFKQQVEGAEEIIFLSKEERERMRERGIEIREHTDADQGDTGEEDL